MADEAPSMEEKLAQLRAQYAVKIQEQVHQLDLLLKNLPHASDIERQDIFAKIRDATHKLAGSGATFGFPDVTVHARSMEQACIAVLDTNGDAGQGIEDTLKQHCDQLRDAVGVEDQNAMQSHVDVARPPAPQLHGSSRLTVLIVMEYDDATAAQTHLEMDHFGFNSRIIDHPSKLINDIQTNGPVDAIIAGLVFDDDEKATLKVLEEFRKDEQNHAIPIVVHTALDSIESRLGAVRIGVKAYLLKPVDMADMVDVLDHVTQHHEDEPFRVLVIDDDESLARHTEIVLQSAGMSTEIVTDPMELFRALDNFSPELILLDLYMPGCNGQEIAAIVRQREEYAGIPIVFLSGESDKDKQLLAMELGGDDFLTKPIRASHLISSVRIRASRFRKLRSFMARDSMTGLFNHTTTKQLLDNEVARVQRINGTMALAALDIDHFKKVNDNYGHAVGDRVIKALARLLRQRLRSADVIGRMGGEEFAAILPDSDLDQAKQVFNQVREAFSNIVFHTGDQSFGATFSCGVAAFPHSGTATELSDAADKALYVAKRNGRNQVVKAESALD